MPQASSEVSFLATGDCGPVRGPKDGFPIERYIVERNGIKVGFLGYCSVIPQGGEAGPGKVGIAPLRVRTCYEPRGPHAPVRVLTEPDEKDMKMILDDVAALRRRAVKKAIYRKKRATPRSRRNSSTSRRIFWARSERTRSSRGCGNWTVSTTPRRFQGVLSGPDRRPTAVNNANEEERHEGLSGGHRAGRSGSIVALRRFRAGPGGFLSR